MTRSIRLLLKSGFSVSPKLDSSLMFYSDSLYFLSESNNIARLFINNSRNQETAAVIDCLASTFLVLVHVSIRRIINKIKGVVRLRTEKRNKRKCIK